MLSLLVLTPKEMFVKLRLMTYRDVSNGGKFKIESRSKAKDLLLLGEMTCSKFN